MSGSPRFRRAAHLSGRFFSSLVPRPVSKANQAFVASVLADEELALWRRMRRADRAESVRVARAVALALAGDPRLDDWCAAALLHDVGKLDAGFGSYGRVVATLAGGLAGHALAPAWQEKSGFTRRVGLYLQHPRLGAQRIRVVGGREVAAEWAEIHHDPSRWASAAIPEAVCVALARADGEIT